REKIGLHDRQLHRVPFLSIDHQRWLCRMSSIDKQALNNLNNTTLIGHRQSGIDRQAKHRMRNFIGNREMLYIRRREVTIHREGADKRIEITAGIDIMLT